jgi:hypothetical protein
VLGDVLGAAMGDVVGDALGLVHCVEDHTANTL